MSPMTDSLWYILTYIWMVDFNGICIGKYTSLTDPMGQGDTQFPSRKNGKIREHWCNYLMEQFEAIWYLYSKGWTKHGLSWWFSMTVDLINYCIDQLVSKSISRLWILLRQFLSLVDVWNVVLESVDLYILTCAKTETSELALKKNSLPSVRTGLAIILGIYSP